MTLDVRGSRKNTRLSKNKFVVVEELLANSIDAYLILRSVTDKVAPLKITILAKVVMGGLLKDTVDLELSCTDNGCGLGPEQIQAFLTKDTSYKDDLNIAGIGPCKGSGRIQFFHHFSNVEIYSTYAKGDAYFQAVLPRSFDLKVINEDQFGVKEIATRVSGTTISLSGLQEAVTETMLTPDAIYRSFTAPSIKDHILFTFLQRLVGLKEELGSFQILLTSEIGDKVETLLLTEADLPEPTDTLDINVKSSAEGKEESATLRVTHYKLNSVDYDLPKNLVALCAKSAIVTDVTKRYLKTGTVENNPIDGAYHIILVEGSLLDKAVNEQRDDFDGIPKDSTDIDFLSVTTISYEDVFEVLNEIVQRFMAPPGWSKEAIVSDVAVRFGMSEQMLSASKTRVVFGDTSESVATRVLTKVQKQVIEDTSNIFDLKHQIELLDPKGDEFREKVNELAWKYTSTLASVDMANLSQLIVRRAALIDILALAVKRNLEMQKNLQLGERRSDEAIIHNIFFPMKKDSDEVLDHDVWLLSEEYHYFDYITSDMPLKGIKVGGDELLFESDIDSALQDVFTRRTEDNKRLRPDIALFHEEGSVVIVEFKAPGVSMDDHIGDLMEYSQLLAAKSKGKLKKFYGYLIGDTVNELRIPGYKPLTGARGFFNTDEMIEPKTRRYLGELYSEILYYDDIVDRARKRLGVYKDRLNLKFGS